MNTNEEDAPLSDAEVEVAANGILHRPCPSPVADETMEFLIKLHGPTVMDKRYPGWRDLVKPGAPGIRRTVALLYSVTHTMRKREWGTDLSGLSVLALALRRELHDQFATLGLDPARMHEVLAPTA